MNNFWRYVIKTAVAQGYEWERIIKGFPELDDEVVKAFYNELTKRKN